ncbi:MAG TPA: hypothetical protein VF509_03335 [Sphingobium sp.]
MAIILASVVVPIAIGAFRGIGLNRAADGNQTFSFAETYLDEVVAGSRAYQTKRRDFARIGSNQWGVSVNERSPCQDRLERKFSEDEWIVSGALSSLRSNVLADNFDYPGIKAIEDMPSFLTGALRGCRYTLLTAACDAWARAKILSAVDKSASSLKSERDRWLSANEKASCMVADKIEKR